jgi:hypothetical protein
MTMRMAKSALATVPVFLLGLGIAPQLAAQGAADPGQSGYSCCNFRYDGDYISDGNWLNLPRIPAGTPVRVIAYGDYLVTVDIGGRSMRLGLDYGRKQSLRAWVQKMVVTEDPKETIETWPAHVRDAIAAGRVALGMSKEQTIVALGYPPAHATPSLDDPQWRYWHTTHGTYLVVWDASGLVKDVVAAPETRRAVLFATDAAAPSSSGAGPVQLRDLEGLLPGK